MKLIIFSFLLLFSNGLIAQEPYPFWITEQQGLPSNTVYHVYHDTKGFTWLATEEGLCRYDGTAFKKYHNNKQTSVPGSDIKQDVTGRIWYQNFDGYCYYIEHDSLKSLHQNQPLNYNPIGMNQKFLFVLQTQGVDVFDINTLKLIKTVKPQLPFKNLQSSYCINGLFYFIDGYTLYSVGDDLVIKKEMAFRFLSNHQQLIISQYNKSPATYLKYSETNKISFFQTGKGEESVSTPGPIGINGTAFIMGKFAIYGNSGLLIYENNKVVSHWFKNQNITSISKDFQGNYWISTLSNGVILLKDIYNHYKVIEQKPTKIISTEKAHYVFNSVGDILYYNKNFSLVNTIAKLAPTAIYYAHLDQHGGRLFTSSLGMNIIELDNHNTNNKFVYALKEVSKINDNLYALAVSSQCLLYKANASILNDGWDSLYAYLPHSLNKGFKVLAEGFRAKTVAYHRTSSTLYYGTNTGLFKQTPTDRVEVKYKNEKVFAKNIIATKQKIYVLNTKGEFYELNSKGTFTLLNNLTSISCNNISGVKLFNDTLLCLYGDNRLVLVDADSPSILISNPDHIIKTAELNDVSFANQTLYLLTKNGVISVPINIKKKPQHPPRFIVDDIHINGRQGFLNNMTLEYIDNNITINYLLIDYDKTARNKVFYSLNNNEWVEMSTMSRVLQFAALDAGKYTIRFMINTSIIADNEISFEILKPWWLRWWFLSLMFCSVSLLIFSLYRWQINIVHKRNALLKQNYELEKELNKSVLKSIKSQMNPHFFYNALNTIQGYIFTNDKNSAANYLNKFSKLTRSVLEMSDKEYVNLEEEINALDLYLSLEKMRFDGELTYEIIKDESLKTDTIRIPPMLIQPHVENAVKHGLLHKDGHKMVLVSFQLHNGNQLKIVVDDNGIGRKKSQELNAIKNQRHESFSTEANQTRISLMNKLRNAGASLEIKDKFDEQSRSTGTLVTIILPYQNY